MEALDAIKAMIDRSNASASDISRSMGRNWNFISNTLNRGSVPKADTLALIADACDYDLVLMSRSDGYDFVIAPHGKEDEIDDVREPHSS